ncbi:peptidase inhibitor family I36 protein [Scytonema sp. NUACC26]|uniref:peptidase inhibitor family I36 protein n=1 Tax=Scytonema sp. NUACC26 TaxID=3140176 RepID=UPI0034DC7389
MKVNQFEEISAIQELNNEAAASCSGGKITVYRDRDFKGDSLTFYNKDGDLRYNKEGINLNDAISSVVIEGNETWAFYRDPGYKSLAGSLHGPGRYSFVKYYGIPNDLISSLKREYPPIA